MCKFCGGLAGICFYLMKNGQATYEPQPPSFPASSDFASQIAVSLQEKDEKQCKYCKQGGQGSVCCYSRFLQVIYDVLNRVLIYSVYPIHTFAPFLEESFTRIYFIRLCTRSGETPVLLSFLIKLGNLKAPLLVKIIKKDNLANLGTQLSIISCQASPVADLTNNHIKGYAQLVEKN